MNSVGIAADKDFHIRNEKLFQDGVKKMKLINF